MISFKSGPEGGAVSEGSGPHRRDDDEENVLVEKITVK